MGYIFEICCMVRVRVCLLTLCYLSLMLRRFKYSNIVLLAITFSKLILKEGRFNKFFKFASLEKTTRKRREHNEKLWLEGQIWGYGSVFDQILIPIMIYYFSNIKHAYFCWYFRKLSWSLLPILFPKVEKCLHIENMNAWRMWPPNLKILATQQWIEWES